MRFFLHLIIVLFGFLPVIKRFFSFNTRFATLFRSIPSFLRCFSNCKRKPSAPESTCGVTDFFLMGVENRGLNWRQVPWQRHRIWITDCPSLSLFWWLHVSWPSEPPLVEQERSQILVSFSFFWKQLLFWLFSCLSAGYFTHYTAWIRRKVIKTPILQIWSEKCQFCAINR